MGSKKKNKKRTHEGRESVPAGEGGPPVTANEWRGVAPMAVCHSVGVDALKVHLDYLKLKETYTSRISRNFCLIQVRHEH